jgi:hypothetical protein
MKRPVIFFLLSVAAAVAASNLNAPLVGLARDAHGMLRLVQGVAGSFVVRNAMPEEALNWAFAASGGLMKTANELRVLDAGGHVIARRTAPASQVILNPYYAYFPETGELWRAGAQGHPSLMISTTALGGRVIALGPADQHGIVLAACRADHLWLLTLEVNTGAVENQSAPGGTLGEHACRAADGTALLVLEDRMLLATAQDVVVETTSGRERHVPIPANHGAQIHRFGEDMAQIEVSGAPSVLLRVTAEGEQLYQLPAAEARP